MADPNQYKYAAMSNLVLRADKSLMDRVRRTDDATGDPESLSGKVNSRDMGSRVARNEAPKDKLKKKAKAEKGKNKSAQELEDEDMTVGARKRRRDAHTHGVSTILTSTNDIANLTYHPRTAATQATYSLILTLIHALLGDVSHSMVRSAADAVLEILKDTESGKKDFDKKKEIEELLSDSIDSKKYNELVNLSKKITDYDVDDDEEVGDKADREDGEELDDRAGVAVVFDEEDEDEDDVGEYEVKDVDTTDEEDDDIEMAGQDDNVVTDEAIAEKDNGDEMIIDFASESKTGEDKDIIPAHTIDAFWLQRQISNIFKDAHTTSEKTSEAFDILVADEDDKPLRQKENELIELLDYNFGLVRVLMKNTAKIVWCTRLARAAEGDGKRTVEKQLIHAGAGRILEELRGRELGDVKKQEADRDMDIDITPRKEGRGHGNLIHTGLQPRRIIDIENLIFEQGNHLMTNPNVKLPQGSAKRTFKGYEEIHVPAPKRKHDPNEPALIPISSMPEWARVPFTTSGSKQLNRVQTKVYSAAFEDDGNLLICAPTGSGKTNVAMLAILREFGKHRDEITGKMNLDEFKIVYIAPLKALVQEQVGNFGKRLGPYGVTVSELTGDRQLTKQQIMETHIIITTPEKWDVITRKATDLSYTNLVRLIIIDEIHLLHDERGPVLESIVSRTVRKMEQTLEPVRLVGLSATLPNYRDVATFLRVDIMKGLFWFDATFRPCPLKQEFIGVTDKKPIKQLQTMNDVAYTKVIEQAGENQMLIFVHSRKDTAKTAKYIRDKAVELETIGKVLKSDAATREILRTEAENVSDSNLKDLLPYGFAIHHAGMNRADRTTVEDLFAEGAVQVLVCTATLAWGVNLPAHTVIIKGTQIYSPEKGSWVELSPQDVLQMLGRAGRPQFDTYGEGIIITTQNEMQYYLSLLNQQLPIESQFMRKLADNLNAEVVLGTVRTRDEGVEWLGYSYLYVRMLRSPSLYSIGMDYPDDEALEQKRVDLIHSAATILEKCKLVKYDKKSGRLQGTELGRIASHYYISHKSMLTYSHHLQPGLSPIELFRVFALSEEFKYIPVRHEEKVELAKLLVRVPIPVKEGVEESQSKINVLLQAYISRLKLEGLALMADMVYVTQSAGRILRAIFEICLKRGWASVAKTTLDICKMVEKRMWPTMSPLRQFPNCTREVIIKMERMDVDWQRFFDMDPPTIGEALGMPRQGKFVHALLQKFPRLEVQAQVQPITRTMLRVELTITSNFEWDDNVHGAAESWWIVVEDCDGEEILFHDQFVLRRQYAIQDTEGGNEHLVEFTVPIQEPMPPNYFITLVSDRWMHAETKLAVSFRKLVLPDKFPPHTPLLDLQPLPVTALKKREFVELYPYWERFNKIQTQVFNSLFTTDDNVFIGAPTGSGKTVCAEFALLRHWSKGGDDVGRAVYIGPLQELIDRRYQDWKGRLSTIGGGKEIVKLTGDTTVDLKLLEKGDLILSTPSQWDVLSRAWQRRKNVQTVRLFIADELHMLGGTSGYIFEIVVSRMIYIAAQTERPMRIVALSVSLSDGKNIGEWIGADSHTIYNFSPRDRPVPLEIHIQSSSIPHFPSMMLALAKPVYFAISEAPSNKPVLIFVPSRKQVRATALDIHSYCLVDDKEGVFLNTSIDEVAPHLSKIQERTLAESISRGIGYYHEGLSKTDKTIVEHLFDAGAFKVLIASRDVAWELSCTAAIVIIMGTQFFEGREHRYIDYPLAEVLQMFGRACRPGEDKVGKAILLCPATRKEYYRKFLNEALPVESHLHLFLHDAFVTEISTKTIASTQDAVDWMTYTYFYRRLLRNPSFYSLSDRSHDGLSAYLSEMVENTLKELSEAKIIDIDEEDDSITPLNAAMIAAYYNISFITMQTFLLSLTGKTKLKGILEIVTSATEFETIPIRRHEDKVLRTIYDNVPVRMSQPNYESPHFKAFTLLQAHFSRMKLVSDLATDQKLVLSKIINLLSACVDILSSDGHLNAMSAMEMSQMCVQAMWDRDSPLLQIPHFTPIVVATAEEAGISDVFEFMDKMDPENPGREALLQRLRLNQQQLAPVAHFTNSYYPSVDMEHEVLDPDSVIAGSPAYVQVTLDRGLEDNEEPDLRVHAPFYPGQKMENWWLVIGEESTKSLLAIKRVTIGRKLTVKLEYVVSTPGRRTLSLSLMCDSYVGVDQEQKFEIQAAEGMDEDEEEDEE